MNVGGRTGVLASAFTSFEVPSYACNPQGFGGFGSPTCRMPVSYAGVWKMTQLSMSSRLHPWRSRLAAG